MTRTTVALAALVSLVAAPLAAQHEGHAMPAAAVRHAPDSVMSAIHRLSAFAPARVMDRARDLGLTPAQEARIATLAGAARITHDSLATAGLVQQRLLAAVLRSAMPDPGAVARGIEALHAAKGATHAADLRYAAEALAVLTESQRARLVAAGTPGSCPMMSGHGGGDAH